MEKSKLSRVGFFSIGVTCACLKDAGKISSVNDRLASLAMSSEKTDENDLIIDVGM